MADYFERYSDVIYEIPFVRMGWDYERLHEGPEETGEKLLFALCSQPLGEGYDTRFPVLDSLTQLVTEELLAEIPEEGFSHEILHERLDDTPYGALALYSDWLFGETDSLFLDSTDEMQFGDAEWSRENFELLEEDWQRADSILDRIASLQHWLLEDTVQNFGRLLSACLVDDPHLKYLSERRLYACEVTEQGLVPNRALDLDQHDVDRTEGEPVGEVRDGAEEASAPLPARAS